MAIVPAETVPAPQPMGLRYGLFTVANGPLPLPGHGSGGGVQYEPVTCGRAHRLPIDCPDESPVEVVFDEAPGWVEAEPFQVYGSITCGSIGHTQAELEAIAVANLASGEQGQVEAELAALLADATDAGAAVDLVEAVSALEQWIYGTQEYGHPAVLHASVGAAALAAAADQVVQDGPRKRTPYGSLWSFGLYPPGSVWVTGQVTVWRNDIWTPDPNSTLDRVTNQYHIHGSRDYAVAYDCYAAAVSIEESP